ncbi:MAG: PilZ domain-containing protein [Treponema sp.]|jgi:hypothetical protein|nr:PilZ domain-containing protein [Treponema sp.]
MRGFIKDMATPVKNIEKEFMLKILYDEGIPVIYLKDRIEHLFFLKKPAGEELFFQTDKPIKKLKVKDQIDLMFGYRGKSIVFTVEVTQINDAEITCTMPDFLYKDLDRSYSRVSVPSEMQVQFTFLGERYDLSFPKVAEYETGDGGDILQNSDPKSLSGLIEQMATWIKNFASAYRLVLFKDAQPSTVEERIISETGKTLFLPSTKDGFLQSDPFPQKRIITEDMFKRYLESTGIGPAFIGNACTRFIKTKTDNKIFSDAWIPILFHEYVIGYIHIWNNVDGKPPFDYKVIDVLYQFAKVLAYSLKINGYFEKGKIKNDTFEGKVIDISASGLLFAYPHSKFASALQLESKLTVKIITPQRSITTEAIIVRRFKDKTQGYYGCQFEKMETTNLGYLFESIYGKPLTDLDAQFLTGQV